MTNEERNTRITERMDELKLTFCHGHYWSHEYGTPNDYTNVSTVINSHSTETDLNGNIVHNVYGSCGCNSYNGSIQCHGFAMYMAYLVFGTNLSISSEYNGETGVEIANSGGWIVHTHGNYNGITIEPGDIIRLNGHTAMVWEVQNNIVSVAEVWGSVNSKIAWGYFNGVSESAYSTVEYLKSQALYIVKSPGSVSNTTATIDLYRNHTTTDATLYKNDLNYTPGSADVINGGSAPTRAGYRFNGWYTARSGGTKVTKYSDIPAGTATLYAQWVETVTVSYMKNIDVDGGPVVCVKTHDVGAALRPLPAMEERPGYTFIGWFTSATGGGKYEDYSVAKSSRTKIWAHWEYNIELYLNEGDTVPVKTVTANSSKCYGELVSAGMYTKCGYDHVGWAYDAERKNECDLADYVDNKTKKLYAIWKVKKVKVNYNYGYEVNGSAVTGEGNVDYGETYDDVTGTDVPDMGNMVHPDGGYDFAGWYHDKVEETDKVAMDVDHTLTAKWDPKEFTVSFIAGDECDFMKPIPPVTVRYGEKFGCLPKPSSNKLYDFSRWYVVYEDGEIGDTVTSDTIVTQTGPFSLKAEWIIEKYVMYNYEDEEGNKVHSADHMRFGEAYTNVPILTEKTGYDVKWIFSGQNSPYDGTQFFPGMIVSPEHPSDINSEYALKYMRINFDYNGGIDEDGSLDQHQMQRYGDPYATVQYNPTREGFILAGWYYDRECTMPIEADDVIANPEPHTIYAGWTTKLVTVTFDAGAYANDCGTKSVGVGLPYGELPVPVSNKHHIFNYWEIGEEDNDEFYGVEVRPDSIVEMDVDHTLAAIWESRRWLYLDPNGGTVSNNKRSVHYGEMYPYLFVPEREGYEFAGWFFREGEYDGIEVTMELMVLPEHPDTVVAEWIPISEE